MADRYTDEESGIIFHYSPDMNEWIEIVVPPGADGDGTSIAIPPGALVRFFFEAVLSREKAILLTKAFATVAGALGETVERFADHAFAKDGEEVNPGGRLFRAAQALLDWHDGEVSIEPPPCEMTDELREALKQRAIGRAEADAKQRRAVVSRLLRERLALEGGEEGISEVEADDVADHILKAMR
jgi:hypothetical protein